MLDERRWAPAPARVYGTLRLEGVAVMKSLNERLKELFGPQPSDHDWCDTTRLANPWSVLLGGQRRPDRAPGELRDAPAAPWGAGSRDAGRPPATDLRDVWQPPADRGGTA